MQRADNQLPVLHQHLGPVAGGGAGAGRRLSAAPRNTEQEPSEQGGGTGS
ncbi:hypothetical protein GCM10011415_30440 [Salipiger pallidus]|uniref:Uncharacterized protein n=1 Tax=Salipiger pallidus TaxID=1775170 RepID=A0A8J2ZM29_9RHOB|nr:hypothetical protein GCM10011415_30440 [Salipiger pallidus]